MHGNKATRKSGSKNAHVLYSETINKQLISDTNVLVISISSRTSFNSGIKVQVGIIIYVLCPKNGPGSSVGIATGYGLDSPGIESRWGEIFRTWPDRPWGPPSLLYNGYRVFPGGKERPGRDADPLPPPSAVVMKG
jgi:hypothetical protein